MLLCALIAGLIIDTLNTWSVYLNELQPSTFQNNQLVLGIPSTYLIFYLSLIALFLEPNGYVSLQTGE